MKRTGTALLLALLLLTGCGATSSMNAAPSDSAAYDTNTESGWWNNEKFEEAETTETDTGGSADYSTTLSSTLSNAKMIYTADMTLQTKEYDTAIEALDTLVSELGGYFESREQDRGGSYRSLYCVVRVPAEQFSAFLDRSGDIANMTYRSEYSENVSERYYDIESRLTTQRTKLARLQELLANAENMEDIITIESAISETELTIEQLTGSLRQYDSLIGYSTINLSLHEVYRLSTEQETPLTFSERLATAFRRGLANGISNLEDSIIFVAHNWLTLLFWAAVIVVVIVVLRRRRRGLLPSLRKKTNTADTPESPSEKEP